NGGKLAIEAAREIAPDLLDRLLDDIIVVEQPFGGGRDLRAGLHIAGRHLVDAENLLLVFLLPGMEGEGAETGKERGALTRQRLAAIGQVLPGEIGRTDRVVVVDLAGLGVTRSDFRRILRGHVPDS